MAARKKKVEKAMRLPSEELRELVELAKTLNVSEDTFEGEIEDCANDDAKMMAEEINGGTWYTKLEFLFSHGFRMERLRGLLQENAPKQGGQGEEKQ